MQNSRVACYLLEHLAHQGQVFPICLLQLYSYGFKVGFEPFLTVIKVGVFIFDYAFGDLACEGVGYRDIDVIRRNRKCFNQNSLNQKAGCDLAFS